MKMNVVLILHKKSDAEPMDVLTCVCPEQATEILEDETDFMVFLRKLLKSDGVVDIWSDLTTLIYSTAKYNIRSVGWGKVEGLIGYLTYK